MESIDLDGLVRRVEACYDTIKAHARSKMEFHRNYQRMLVALAADFGCVGEAEFEVPEMEGEYRGFIDVAWLRDSKIILAIEIDSASRQKSLKKLGKMSDCERLWIYYGRRTDAELRQCLEFPLRLRLVCLPYTGRHSFHSSI
ncbi:hypothetical protein ACL58G_21575 [Massilia sp. GER05]|uniref:hypothetical protein n=1 Tax=Massilia sp. GER05 TaxID=3394605 RepID=UPI003F85DC97